MPAEVATEVYPLLIGGELVTAAESFAAVNPHDNTEVARISLAGPAEIDRALAAARAAADGPWRHSTGKERAAALRRIADQVEKHADDLAYLEAVDTGKPIGSVHYSDLATGLDALEYHAAAARTARTVSATLPEAGVHHHALREPYGVVAEILPWNGPLWTGIQHVAAILAAGNAVVVKPAEWASLSFARFAQLLAEADLPPGVVNVVAGPGGVVGDALVADPRVDLVSLTGSVETGRKVLARVAPRLARVSLELGGKNPNLVFADADLDQAAFWSALGAFANSGQICVCGSRILVQRPAYAEFVSRLAAAAEAYVVGDPLDSDTQLGPVISTAHAEKVWGYVETGRVEGRLVAGGERYTDPVRAAGCYVPPTVFADAAPDCRIATEEIFGPVVAVLPFDTVDEAVAIANATEYGLAAGLFTADLDRAWQVAGALRAGQVYVNQWFTPGSGETPSLGYKQSGHGAVADRYSQLKNVFFRTTPPL
jgi:acyl-CoA reductase-like NAD-dependent aldehyde dehydrogenase